MKDSVIINPSGDQVVVEVETIITKKVIAANQLPVITPMPSQSIELPASPILSVVAKDNDGSITSILWTKVSGPAGGTIQNPTLAVTGVTGLTVGTHVFKVKATDNAGGFSEAQVTVVVKDAPVVTPPVGSRKDLIAEVLFDKPIPPSGQGSLILANVGDHLSNEQSNVKTLHDGGQPIRSAKMPLTGEPAAKFTITYDDPLVSSSNRVEASRAGRQGNATGNEVHWYGGRWFFEKLKPVGGGESIVQFHDNDQGGIPPLSFHLYNNSLAVAVLTNTPQGPTNTYYQDLITFQEGKAYDIVFYVKWSTAKTGAITVWVNGVKVLEKTGIMIGLSQGSNLKLGMNAWHWNKGIAQGMSRDYTRIFYISQWREGGPNANYDTVKPV